jgi:hypothetical protein
MAIEASSAQGNFSLSLESQPQLMTVGSVRPTLAGPTLILSFNMPEGIEDMIEIALHIVEDGVRDYELKTNSSPYKGVKLETLPAVGES